VLVNQVEKPLPKQDQNEHWMGRTLELARAGVALTSPNPCVGAVIVGRDGELISEGCHTYDQLKHAEVLALERAGKRARGAILYVNLEPCSHAGRTAPCVNALIEAGISCVYASMRDPNPQVAGKGFDKLRAAGIEVHEGLLQSQARKLNEAFAKYIVSKRPLVTLKAGMTLDGKIAPPPGGSTAVFGAGGATGGWITSEEARAHVQELRHMSDAIMVGVGTVVADDPLLTERTGLPRRRPLLRVIMDSRLRLPLQSRLVKTAKDDLLVFCSFAEEKKRRELESHGVRVEQVRLGSSDGRPDLLSILSRLGELEITSILIEGGALLNWTALACDCVDKIFLYYAPKILAGTGSVPFAAGAGFQKMSEAAHVRSISVHRFGEDFAVEGYLHDPYEEADVHRPH
jgi:diaminohydroxyphosphoribosylaminopyrimidine deaminase / 5-amino-6-(5-phosphoribosylamino)uracil reductase